MGVGGNTLTPALSRWEREKPALSRWEREKIEGRGGAATP